MNFSKKKDAATTINIRASRSNSPGFLPSICLKNGAGPPCPGPSNLRHTLAANQLANAELHVVPYRTHLIYW
jgi:hypothetical protein